MLNWRRINIFLAVYDKEREVMCFIFCLKVFISFSQHIQTERLLIHLTVF